MHLHVQLEQKYEISTSSRICRFVITKPKKLYKDRNINYFELNKLKRIMSCFQTDTHWNWGYSTNVAFRICELAFFLFLSLLRLSKLTGSQIYLLKNTKMLPNQYIEMLTLPVFTKYEKSLYRRPEQSQ